MWLKSKPISFAMENLLFRRVFPEEQEQAAGTKGSIIYCIIQGQIDFSFLYFERNFDTGYQYEFIFVILFYGHPGAYNNR